MPSYKVDIPGQGTFEVNSENDLTDAQAYQHAQTSLGKEAEKLPPRTEHSFFEDAAQGFGEGIGASGIPQIMHEVTPRVPGQPLPPMTEGEVRGGKAKQAPTEDYTPGRVIGNIAGGAALGGAISKALPVASTLARATTGGAVTGVLQPTEGPQNFWETKAEQAALGTTLGFGFGLGEKVATPAVSSLMRFIGSKYNPELLEDKAVAEVLQKINESHKVGGPSATDMIDLINQSTKPMVLADQPQLQGLAGRAYRSGPAGKQTASGFLQARDEGAYARVLADVSDHLYSGQSMFNVVEGLTTAQKAAAAPLYAQAEAVKEIWSLRLREFFGHPELKSGLKRGYQLERLESAGENRPFNPHVMGMDIDADGNVILTREPNLRVLDMGKRGLDAMIEEQRDKVTGKLSTLGRSLSIFRKGYLDEIDGLDSKGIYKKARDTWGGFQAAKDAIAFGRHFGGESPEELRAEFDALSPSNKEMARVGVADMLRERVMKTGFNGDEAKALLKNPWLKEQLRPFFKSNENYEQFVEKVLAEQTMKGTMNTVMKGSQTAEREAEDMARAHGYLRLGSAAKIAMSAANGHILRGIGESWRLYRDFKKGVPDPAFDAEVAKVLFAPDLLHTAPGIRFMQKVAEAELAKAAPAKTPFYQPGMGAGTAAGAATGGMASHQDVLTEAQ